MESLVGEVAGCVEIAGFQNIWICANMPNRGQGTRLLLYRKQEASEHSYNVLRGKRNLALDWMGEMAVNGHVDVRLEKEN